MFFLENVLCSMPQGPNGPRAQGPIEASSSSEESAPVKVTVCGAQRCWKRSKVLGQTRSKPQKGWTLVKSYQNSGKLYRVPLGIPI